MSENPYQSPQVELNTAQQKGSRDSFSAALKVGIVIQIALFPLTALIMDGGVTNRLCVLAMIGYWIGVAVIIVRRGASPTKLDLFFLRYGVVGLFLATFFLAPLVYRIIGKSSLSGLERLTGRRIPSRRNK